ncbi:MAG: putative zinc-binding metallopeptidase [Planctomycetes bacterium]|nr:putative zinc-binding metallopeptidase [Planctomycetota bacterium]
MSQDELLDVRIQDLDLRVEGTAVGRRVERLYADLERAGLRFRPHVWLSTDWFTPDGVLGFAMPFYLAHPRLARLEHAQMLEVEGGGHVDCLKLLRHETGHAIDNAYRLRRRRSFRETFGSPGSPYRDWYAPRPASREHVQHLDQWYAQSHPLEDFAETFAVWLTPRSQWRQAYRDWPALRKLDYIDRVMTALRDRAPLVRSRARPDSLQTVRITLREYYETKKAQYSRDAATAYDRLLLRVFATRHRRSARRADVFLRANRQRLRSRIAELSGQHRYVVDQMLKALTLRCRELGLYLHEREADARTDVAVLVTALTMRFLRSGGRTEYMR